MPEIKVIVKDFRILKDVKIIIDGIVGIVGENNNGKSGLFKSIKALCNNIGGDRQIRDGCKQASVGLAFMDPEGEKKVIWQKDTSPRYLLNGVLYEKTGKTVPKEIEEALNMAVLEIDDFKLNLNFLDQMQEPILMRLSEYQLYNVTIKSFDGEKINDAVKKAKKESDEYRDQIKDKSIEVDVQKKNKLIHIDRLNAYNELAKIKNEYLVYEAEFSRTPRIEGFHNRRIDVKFKILIIDDKIVEISKMSEVVKEFKILEIESNKNNKIQGFINRRKELKSGIEINGNKIKVLTPLSELQTEYISIEKEIDRIESIGLNKDRGDSLRSRIDKINKTIEITKSINQIIPGFGIAKKSKESLSKLEILKSKQDAYIIQRDMYSIQIKGNTEELDHLEIQQKGGIVYCEKCKQKILKPTDMEFNDLKTKIEELQKKNTELEGSKGTLQTQLDELDKEIKAEGWDPNDLAGEIEKSRNRISEFEKKATPIIEAIEKNLAKANTATVVESGSESKAIESGKKGNIMEGMSSGFDEK